MFSYLYNASLQPRYFNAAKEYFRSGAQMYRALAGMLRGAGKELESLDSILRLHLGVRVGSRQAHAIPRLPHARREDHRLRH
jgi:hypothetical protein